MNNATRLTLALSPLLALAAGCQKKDTPTTTTSTATAVSMTPVPGAPTLELFVMSKCPYGVQVENAVIPVKKQLGGAFDLKIFFIGDGTAGSLTSMHGPPEVTGDLVQVCAAQLAPDKYLDLIACQNKNPRVLESTWKECATEAGIDAAALDKCQSGDEGQKLLAASFEEARKRGATGSPTMFLNGKPYQGGRKSRDFLKAICAEQKEKSAACSDIPEAPVVHAVFFSDKRCKECNIAPLESRLKSELGGLTVKNVDYMTDEGKALYAELVAAEPTFKMLPTVLLDPEVEKDADGYKAVKQYLRKVGKYQELQVGGKFDPTAEICDNTTDDNGDGKADCADPTCKEAMVCREAKPKTLDLFVMSHCPYGAKALIAANDVVDHFGSDLTLNVHYIGDENDGKLASMHGQPEVDDDIREVCAIKHYAKDHQYMKFLACISADYKNADWKACAKSSNMAEKVLEDCFNGEGKELLSKDFAVARTMKIDASPTFIVNNRREFNAVDPAGIQKEFCQDNPDVKRCSDVVKVTPPAPGTTAAQATPPGGQCN